MGAIVPAITSTVGLINTVNSAFNAVGNLRSNVQGVSNAASGAVSDQAYRQMVAEQNQALIQLQQRQALDERQRAESAALEKEKLALDARQTEEQRQNALRRAVARQRASFGGSGLSSSSGGSADAVLLGLFDESEDELRQREALDKLRNTAIDLGAAQAKSVNVLQATQLAEKNKLHRLFFN